MNLKGAIKVIDIIQMKVTQIAFTRVITIVIKEKTKVEPIINDTLKKVTNQQKLKAMMKMRSKPIVTEIRLKRGELRRKLSIRLNEQSGSQKDLKSQLN
jgi:hypothetical protein